MQSEQQAQSHDGAAAADHPGAGLGLPASGPGSLAGWMARITALVLDWAFSMLFGVLVFGLDVLTADDWRQFVTLGAFFVETSALVAITGASVGQLLCRITVVRVDGQRIGVLRAMARALMVCLVIPALVIGADRRGLHDLALGTVVLSRR
ncbi:RDD family protein [Propionibacteriaceae bacterium Y1685]|uniref:RDD family protein n=1 Tax=Microlunatus sp. Y1700 TaxID=3418487 RepID=UPI003B80BA9E